MKHWSCSMSLASAILHPVPSGPPPGYPIVALCYRDPAVFLSAELAPSHAPTNHRWGGCWGQIKALLLGPGWELGWPTFQLPSSSLPGLAFQDCPANVPRSKEQCHFSCSDALRTGSPAPADPALLRCPGMVWSPLSHSLSKCCSWLRAESALMLSCLKASSSACRRWQGASGYGIFPSPTLSHRRQCGTGSALLLYCSEGQLTCCPGWVHGSLSRVLQTIKDRNSSPIPMTTCHKPFFRGGGMG